MSQRNDLAKGLEKPGNDRETTETAEPFETAGVAGTYSLGEAGREVVTILGSLQHGFMAYSRSMAKPPDDSDGSPEAA